MLYFFVEDLESQAVGLFKQSPSIGYVGVVAEVRALIQIPVPVQVDHDAEGIGMLLEQLSDSAVAEGRGVHVPGNGVATAPVAVGLSADFQSHANTVAGVVRDSPHLDHFPAGSQVAAAHLGVSFKAAGG